MSNIEISIGQILKYRLQMKNGCVNFSLRELFSPNALDL